MNGFDYADMPYIIEINVENRNGNKLTSFIIAFLTNSFQHFGQKIEFCCIKTRLTTWPENILLPIMPLFFCKNKGAL